jgi:2-(1,2-epoxy-1,2-dihydrophenyl)acetyl-CoA isomerase
MDEEVPQHMACGVSEDHREALAAFTGKRPAVFSAPWK